MKSNIMAKHRLTIHSEEKIFKDPIYQPEFNEVHVVHRNNRMGKKEILKQNKYPYKWFRDIFQHRLQLISEEI